MNLVCLTLNAIYDIFPYVVCKYCSSSLRSSCSVFQV